MDQLNQMFIEKVNCFNSEQIQKFQLEIQKECEFHENIFKSNQENNNNQEDEITIGFQSKIKGFCSINQKF